MKVSEVTVQDGTSCALLIKFLANGRWELSGKDADTLAQTKRWLHDIAVSMASQLQSVAPAPVPAPALTPGQAPTSQGFKIKAMGSLAATKPQRKKK